MKWKIQEPQVFLVGFGAKPQYAWTRTVHEAWIARRVLFCYHTPCEEAKKKWICRKRARSSENCALKSR